MCKDTIYYKSNFITCDDSTNYDVLEDFEVCIPPLPKIFYDLAIRTSMPHNNGEHFKWTVKKGERLGDSGVIGLAFVNKIGVFGKRTEEMSFRQKLKASTGKPIYSTMLSCAIGGEITMLGINIGQNQLWDYNKKYPIIQGTTQTPDNQKYLIKIRPVIKQPEGKERTLENRDYAFDYGTHFRDLFELVAQFTQYSRPEKLLKYGVVNPEKYLEELKKADEAIYCSSSEKAPRANIIKPLKPGVVEQYPDGVAGMKWEHLILGK